MKDPATMSDTELLEHFVPPDFLLPALAELVNEALEPANAKLSAKRSNLVKIDNALALGDTIVMDAMNWARGRLHLPVFPDLATYQRYQRLREAGIGAPPPESKTEGWVQR